VTTTHARIYLLALFALRSCLFTFFLDSGDRHTQHQQDIEHDRHEEHKHQGEDEQEQHHEQEQKQQQKHQQQKKQQKQQQQKQKQQQQQEQQQQEQQPQQQEQQQQEQQPQQQEQHIKEQRQAQQPTRSQRYVQMLEQQRRLERKRIVDECPKPTPKFLVAGLPSDEEFHRRNIEQEAAHFSKNLQRTFREATYYSTLESDTGLSKETRWLRKQMRRPTKHNAPGTKCDDEMISSSPACETVSQKSSGEQCLTAASTTPSPNFTSTLGLPVRGFAVSKLPAKTTTVPQWKEVEAEEDNMRAKVVTDAHGELCSAMHQAWKSYVNCCRPFTAPMTRVARKKILRDAPLACKFANVTVREKLRIVPHAFFVHAACLTRDTCVSPESHSDRCCALCLRCTGCSRCMAHEYEQVPDYEYKGTIADYDYFLEHKDDKDDDEGVGYGDLYNAIRNEGQDEDGEGVNDLYNVIMQPECNKAGDDEGDDEDDEEDEEGWDPIDDYNSYTKHQGGEDDDDVAEHSRGFFVRGHDDDDDDDGHHHQYYSGFCRDDYGN
jgi:hypothetical protein